MEGVLAYVFSMPLCLCVTDTFQFDNYSKYKMEIFTPEDKLQRKKELFPKALEAARNMRVQLAKKVDLAFQGSKQKMPVNQRFHNHFTRF